MESKVEKEMCEVQRRSIEMRMEHMEVDMLDINTTLKDMFKEIRVMGKKPSWATLWIISFLTSGLLATLAVLFKWGH